MNKSTGVLVIGMLALMSSFAATSAMATDTRGAIKACDANPNCTYHVGNDITVIAINDGKGNTTGTIACPTINGECTVVVKKRKPTIVGPATLLQKAAPQ